MLLYAVVAMVWYGVVWYGMGWDGMVCYGLLCYWVFNFSWLWKPVCLLWLAGGLAGWLAVCLSALAGCLFVFHRVVLITTIPTNQLTN